MSEGMSSARGIESPAGLSALLSGSALLAIVVGATSWSQPDIDSTDLWWHLSSGQTILQHGQVPYTDPFSHTALGEPWMNHEWLWGLLTWLSYRALPDLVVWMNLGLIASSFGLIAWTARRASGSWLIAGVVTWIAAANCHWFFDLRPHLMTLFFTALLLATIEWRHAPWLWPPVMALWANLHGGFVFGFGLLGLYLAIESARSYASRTELPRSGWIGFAIAAFAVAINPWGFSIYTIPLHVVDPQTPFRDLIEWHPLQVSSLDPRTHSGRFLWTVALASPALLRVRRHPFHIALALVTLIMAFSARRFIMLFAVTAAPVMAIGLAPIWNSIRQRVPAIKNPSLQVGAVALAAALAAALWQNVRLLPEPLYRWTQSESHPSGAAAFLNALAKPPEHLFNYFNWGGYLQFNSPKTPVFIDGRAATLYSDEVARDYLTLFHAGEGWQDLLARYEIDAILVPLHTNLGKAVSLAKPRWRMMHIDSRSILLFPPIYPDSTTEHARERDARSALSEADTQLSAAFHADKRRDLEAAQAALSEVIALEPLQLNAYGLSMQIAALRDDPAGIRQWRDAALHAYPRRMNRIWAFVEQAWLVADRPRERLAALERIHLDSPFIREDVLQDLQTRLREARESVDVEVALEAESEAEVPDRTTSP
jgi:hypothetical protein